MGLCELCSELVHQGKAEGMGLKRRGRKSIGVRRVPGRHAAPGMKIERRLLAQSQPCFSCQLR